MASFNKVILIGNLTRDPQVKYTTSNTAICELSLAINHSYFNKTTNQKVEEVTYVECTFFGRTAEVCGEYLAKGKPLLVEGRLKLETWDDKETGQKRSKLKVIGESMTMLGSGNGGKPANDSSSGGDSGPTDTDSNEVPF